MTDASNSEGPVTIMKFYDIIDCFSNISMVGIDNFTLLFPTL